MTRLSSPILTSKERNCTFSVTLDKRSTRKGIKEYPLSLRFILNKQVYYYHIGSSYSEKNFIDIISARKSKSENYDIQKKWKEQFDQYIILMRGLNPGRELSMDNIKMALSGKTTDERISFIGVWEDIIHKLSTTGRFSTAESYECALRSFKKIMWRDPVKGFHIDKDVVERWNMGMMSGVEDAKGKIVGKISDATRGIYLRTMRVVWNECIKLGYMSNIQYPFSNKKSLGLVPIPKGATRKNRFLTVEQMTQLYRLFQSKEYPTDWPEDYRRDVHISLGLFLAQYLCNGFNLADAGQLKYNRFYFDSGKKAFLFNRQKTAGRSEEGSEVIIPIIEPLQYILDEIAAEPREDAYVFPWILKGATNDKEIRRRTSQENANVRKRMTKLSKECMHWDYDLSGTWCRHSFATNLKRASIDMDYISESMGHSTGDHSVTALYIEHYPLETQMEYNSLLLDLKDKEETDKAALLEQLASLSAEELQKLVEKK